MTEPSNDSDAVSDAEINAIFDDVVGQLPNGNEPAAEASATASAPEAPPQPPKSKTPAQLAHEAIEEVLERLVRVSKKDADPDFEKNWHRGLPRLYHTIALDSTAPAMLAFAIRANQASYKSKNSGYVLYGLAQHTTEAGKQIHNNSDAELDKDDLRDQLRKFLAGEIEWTQVIPHEKVAASPPVDPEPTSDPEPLETRVRPGWVTAAELAAKLGITVVDVLALAGLTGGDGSTKVSSLAVMTAIAAAKAQPAPEPGSTADPEPVATAEPIDSAPAPVPVPTVFDHQEPANQLEDEPITGEEFITIDPHDTLSEFGEDWYVTSCRQLAGIINP
jgi:hypothetical protein